MPAGTVEVATESVAYVLNKIVQAHDAVKSKLAKIEDNAKSAQTQDRDGWAMTSIDHLLAASHELAEAHVRLNTLNQTAILVGATPEHVALANKPGWTWFTA